LTPEQQLFLGQNIQRRRRQDPVRFADIPLTPQEMLAITTGREERLERQIGKKGESFRKPKYVSGGRGIPRLVPGTGRTLGEKLTATRAKRQAALKKLGLV
jgi:hypothetical protein